ncbi:hypothetical protein GCM10025868_22170 [Angustibacter aerolatus]|uniref:Amidohydrolase-related domain-containing protein n=1 Tax=Angustibacter aerolatus TaxID=1162965 RepID=A0ABQ6JFI8_9ACTN|nr:amidohydrolase family protein [Angustibacter aerolatus]GMA86967.1 hypothetical protein GCM10025868_22170 [Angustibacter aerolatus]
MTALRGPAVLDGVLVPDAVVAWDGELLVHAGPAAGADPALHPDPVPAGATVLPGLVDLHCHGAVGGDFAEGDAGRSAAAAAHHLAHGTTSLLTSLVSQAREATTEAVSAAAHLGSPVEGVHLEGPYLSLARRGAHDPALLRDPDVAEPARVAGRRGRPGGDRDAGTRAAGCRAWPRGCCSTRARCPRSGTPTPTSRPPPACCGRSRRPAGGPW